MINKSVYLKENFDTFYTYTHNFSNAKQWSTKELAENEIKKISISILEKTEIINKEDLSKIRYYVNPFTIKIDEVKTNLNYPNLYDTIDEAQLHIDVIRETPDDYENLSFHGAGEGEGDGDSSSGWKEETTP